MIIEFNLGIISLVNLFHFILSDADVLLNVNIIFKEQEVDVDYYILVFDVALKYFISVTWRNIE